VESGEGIESKDLNDSSILTFSTWNPVKELKGNLPAFFTCIFFGNVESGEGIESRVRARRS